MQNKEGVAGLSREAWDRARVGDSVVSVACRVFLVIEVDERSHMANRLHLRNPSGVQFWTADHRTYTQILRLKRSPKWVEAIARRFRGRK